MRRLSHVHIILLLSVASFFGCKTEAVSGSKYYNDSIPVVRFCDLPNFKNREVYLKTTYSGLDEYWSLNNIERKKCNTELRVDLQFAGPNTEFAPITEEFLGSFQYVSNNYYKSYLVLELIGTFEDGNKNGYGHLGHNNARFIVSKIIKAKVIER